MAFYIFLAILLAVVYGVPAFYRKYIKTESVVAPEEATLEIQFYGGPLDGQLRPVPEGMEFYVTPYIPLDENGEPVLNESKIMGQMGDRVYVRSSYAFYQQIDDTSYFYVRDISENEVKILHSNPAWRPSPDEKSEDE